MASVRRLSRFVRREWLSLTLAACAALLALDVVFAPLGLRDLLALRAERGRLEVVHARLLESNAALKIKLRRLQGDDRYLERLIRKQLGYARSGEIVYRFAARADTQ
ncbi:MAG TPA: septum formation initiator family protein [Candidatus Binataceae bacterium]|jgi:cell division protein FtsB|nr:septum formation initiator family protein [Candidatus Binataceae bacterium]